MLLSLLATAFSDSRALFIFKQFAKYLGFEFQELKQIISEKQAAAVLLFANCKLTKKQNWIGRKEIILTAFNLN